MAMLPDVFKPEEAESNEFEVIPAGWYPAEIIKSELKDTKNKDGKFIAFTFRIIDGEFKGRMVFTNLNIVNKNAVAVKMARGDLKAICDAVDIEGDLEDTIDIHNKPMEIKLSVKAETSQWPAKNEIKGYRKEEAPF